MRSFSHLFESKAAEEETKKRLDKRFEKTRNLRKLGVAGNAVFSGGVLGTLSHLNTDDPTLSVSAGLGSAGAAALATHLGHKYLWKKYREREMEKARLKK